MALDAGFLDPCCASEDGRDDASVRLISVILPVYNQADHLAEVTEQYTAALREALPGEVAFELLLVPNGCRDGSLEICQTLAAQNSAVRCAQSPRAGWGAAVRFGLAAARGDLLAYTNLARTTATDLTTALRYALTNPGHVIKANRKIRESWLRRLGSLAYNLECRALFDLPTWDINGTPKVFPRSFQRLLGLRQEGDLIDAEFMALCRRAGYPVLEVPVFSSRRHGGKSTTNWRTAVRLYWGAWRMWLDSRKDSRGDSQYAKRKS